MEKPIMTNVGTFALAGGGGTRLYPLTDKRAKPAVPFGGKWIIGDFVCRCLYYSGLREVGVLTQAEGAPLWRHIRNAWPEWPGGTGDYFDVLSPRGIDGHYRYTGTADAVYQNLDFVAGKEHVLVVAGDHLYMADFSRFLQFHEERNADVSIMAVTTSLAEARGLGVLGVNGKCEIIKFVEKPENPDPIPHDSDHSYCSMGVYVFKREVLERYLEDDSSDRRSGHDFGYNVIPKMVNDGLRVVAFPFSDHPAPGQRKAVWRDIGTIDAYWEEHQNFNSNYPELNLLSMQWQMRTISDQTPPFKEGGPNDAESGRPADNITSNNHWSGGDVCTGSTVRYTTSGRYVSISYSTVQRCILLGRTIVEPDCVLNKVIVDDPRDKPNNVRHVIPADTKIGEDHDEDRARGFHVTDSGIVVVPHTWFAEHEYKVEVD